MRSNLCTKFGDYLREFPNEPIGFVDALKKVQELEEKLEKDETRETGVRKRMGWLRLKSKQPEDKGDQDETTKTAPNQPEQADNKINTKTTTQAAASAAIATAQDSKPNGTTPIISSQNAPMPQPADPVKTNGKSENNAQPAPNPMVSANDNTPNPIKDADNDNKLSALKTPKRRRHNKANLTRTKAPKHKSHPTLDIAPGETSVVVESSVQEAHDKPTEKTTKPNQPDHSVVVPITETLDIKPPTNGVKLIKKDKSKVGEKLTPTKRATRDKSMLSTKQRQSRRKGEEAKVEDHMK